MMTAAVCVALAILLSACGTVNVTGTWTQAGQTTSLTFREDGTGYLTLEGEPAHPFTYVADGSTVTLTGADGTFEYTCQVRGSELTMTGSSGQSAVLTHAA